MALTDFLQKKYQELTAPRLSQPRPNASQVVQNAIVNSIPIVGQLNAFMGRNNGGINPNLNLGKVAQQFPSQVASIGRVGKIGTTVAQNFTNKALKPVYDVPFAGGLINSIVNDPFNLAQRQADFFQKPNLKTGASYVGSGALLASNFAIPAVKLAPKQGLLAQIPNLAKQSSLKVGLPASIGSSLDTYGQGGSREEILRNAYQSFLMGTALGVAFPAGGRLLSNSVKNINSALLPKPQISFLETKGVGKNTPMRGGQLEKPLEVNPFKETGNLSINTLSKLQGKTTAKADNLTSSISKAKASGQSFDEWVKGRLEVDSLLPTDRPLGEKTLADLKFTGNKVNVGKTKVTPIDDVIKDAKSISDRGGDGSVGNYEVYDVLKKIKNGRLKVYHGTTEQGANAIGDGWAGLKDGSYLSLTKGADKEALGVYGAKYYADIADKYGKNGQVLEFEIPTKNIAIDNVTGELRFVSDKTRSQLKAEWDKVGNTITKKLDPLFQEAKKYKSADEFARKIGLNNTKEMGDNYVLYKGVGGELDMGGATGLDYLRKVSDSAKDMPKNTTSYSQSYRQASDYGKTRAYTIPKNKIMPESEYEKLLAETNKGGYVTKGLWRRADKFPNLIPEIQKRGYAGFKDIDTPEIVVFDKSQLTDIWNKANLKTKPSTKPFVEQKPIKTKTSKVDETLLVEARKYKSAEEFVKAQGTPVYHASKNIIKEFGDVPNNGTRFYGKGTYFSKSIDRIKEFGDNIIEARLNLKTPYTEGDAYNKPMQDQIIKLFGKKQGQQIIDSRIILDATKVNGEKLAEMYKKAGYDGIIARGGNDIAVFNPKEIVKTKSQLTDIWNKANKSKTEQSFLGINNPKKESRPITINPLKSDAESVGIYENKLRKVLPRSANKPPATPQPPDKVVFREELNRVLGKQQSGQLRALDEAIPFTKVDGKEAEAIIDAIQDPKANISTYAKYGDYILNIRAKFDELFKEAEDTGMDIGYRENYLPQIWKETDAEIAEKMASVRGGFKFKKERKIPTYAEGKSLGLTPKYTHPAELIEAWVRNFERAKANFEFSQRLQQKGIIVPGDLVSPALPNYRAITAGGFPTSQNNIPFYAPKEIADAINTAFEIKESPRLLDITAQISSKAQDIGLSGGIPRTPINAFSVAQVVKEVTSGRIVSPIASAFRATFGDFRKYVDKNVDVIREIQESGTPLRLNIGIRNFLDQSTSERLFGKSFSEAWNKNISEATFGKFMPMLQIEFYKDVKSQALKSGIANDEAIKVANKALRKFYGLADLATDATRSKVTSDIWTTLVFAPKYRESMIRFWVNNAKALKNPTALENRQNVKFIIGATITAVVYDLLNRQFNEGRGILDNPPGKEDKLLIPLDDGRTIGVPFLSSIATLPRTAFKIGKNVVTGDFKQAGLEAKALGSFAYKPLLDIIQNEDYFGNKVVDDDSKNAVRDRFAYLTKAYAHPYMRELLNAYAPDWLATKSQQDVPVSQRLMQAFELPIRFYKTSGIKGSYYYKAKDDNLKKLSTKERELYDKLNAPSEVDDAGLPVYNIRSEMANALDRLSNPKITQIETKIALDTARSTGEKPNPFYLLSPKQQETVLLLKTFYPGDKTKSEITNANKSWLEPYWKARDEFIGGLKAKGVIKENPSFNQRPQPTPQLQAKLDYYNTLPSGTGARSSFIRANSDIEQFFNDSRNYTNAQRADLGLPLLAGYTASKGRKPKKLKAIKIRLPKIKKIKVAKIKKPKKIKTYSLKKIKSKKVKLRTSLT